MNDFRYLTIQRKIGSVEESIPREIAVNPVGQDVAICSLKTQQAIIRDGAQVIAIFKDGVGFRIPQKSYLFLASA